MDPIPSLKTTTGKPANKERHLQHGKGGLMYMIGATTFIIITLSIMALNFMDLIATLSINDT
jgi:hypothetical protein